MHDLVVKESNSTTTTIIIDVIIIITITIINMYFDYAAWEIYWYLQVGDNRKMLIDLKRDERVY